MNIIRPMLEGLKTAAVETYHFLAYVVTLGHHTRSRAEESQKKETIVKHEVKIEKRELNTKDREVNAKENEDIVSKFMKELEEKQADKFRTSVEFKTYEKETNPFNTIEDFYKRFKENEFLKEKPEERREEFKKSFEFSSYKYPVEPTNPFEEPVISTIEAAYEQFETRISEEIRAQIEKFQTRLAQEEVIVWHEFYDNSEFSRDTNLKTKPVCRFEDVQRAFEAFKENVKKANDEFLEGKEDFKKSEVFRAIEEMGIPLTNKIKEVYEKYVDKRERDAFIKDLITKGLYNGFMVAKENDRLPQDYTSQMLKDAFIAYDKRVKNEFMEEVKDKHKDEAFEDSAEYGELINKDSFTLVDIKEAYRNFNNRRYDEYLNRELKSKIQPKEFISFIGSQECIQAPQTREGIEAAYGDFEKRMFWEGIGEDKEDLEMLLENKESPTIEELKNAYEKMKTKFAIYERIDDEGYLNEFEISNEYTTLEDGIAPKDLKQAYEDFHTRRRTEYIDGLKKTIGEGKYNEFIESDAYKNIADNIPLTKEAVESAYQSFRGWFGGFWGY